MVVDNFFLSETCRSTLDYIPIDRSDQDLSNDVKISREKSGPVVLIINTLRTTSNSICYICML